MFKIIISRNGINTHGATKETLGLANSYVDEIKAQTPCPWGLIEREIFLSQATEEEILLATSTIPEVVEDQEIPQYDENGEFIGNVLTPVVVSEAKLVLPQDFEIEILDITAQHAAEQETQQLIAQGEANERKCRKALAYIGGYNEARNLDAAQTNTMQATFGTVFQMLLANRPNTAKQLITEIAVDDVLVTQQLKDVVIGLLS